MTAGFSSIETWTRVAPLGVRFFDRLTALYVHEGLRVRAQARTGGRIYSAQVNQSGVFVFHDLPVSRDLIFGAGDTAYWNRLAGSPNSRVDVNVMVDDLRHRFVPMAFRASVPHRGLFELTTTPAIGSPVGSPPSLVPAPVRNAVELFTATHRIVEPSFATIRAELVDPAGEPRPWVRIEVWHGASLLGASVSDAKGQIAVPFAYPDVDASVVGAGPLHTASWRVDLVATQLTALDDFVLVGTTLTTSLRIWDVHPTNPIATTTVPYGRPVVLRSTGTSTLAVSP